MTTRENSYNFHNSGVIIINLPSYELGKYQRILFLFVGYE